MKRVLTNHCKYKQIWKACSYIIINTSKNWASFQKALFLQYQINLNPAGQVRTLPADAQLHVKTHLADSIPEWGWFYIVKTMLFEKSLNLCLYLQWDMNMPFISACIYNGSWACVSFLLVFTMVLERVCQLLLVFTMSLKHEIKEINILLVFTMAW